MAKVMFTYDYGEEKMQCIRDMGYEVICRKEKDLRYDETMEDVEVLVCYTPFHTLDITRMKKLRWIQLSSIGIDQVPKEIARKMNLIITNNRGGYSIPMGEWIVHKILDIYKQSRVFENQQKERRWLLSTDVMELEGKRVAFIGTGTIAQEAAKRLKGFDVELLGFNTSGHAVLAFDQCFSISLLDQWLPRIDILVMAVPSTAMTHRLLNKTRMRKMKDKAVLVNVSRGSVIDEAGLIELLQEGKFMGVALDVFEQEPLASDYPLWGFKQVHVSPHNSWVSEMRNERRFQTILENLKRYKEKLNVINRVDLDKGY